jgi:chromosome segregation ATPase
MVKPGGAAWTEEARRKAQAQFAKTKKDEADIWREREKLHQADAEKTTRLKALRLAKEAADKEAAAAAPKVVALPRKKRAPKVVEPVGEDL